MSICSVLIMNVDITKRETFFSKVVNRRQTIKIYRFQASVYLIIKGRTRFKSLLMCADKPFWIWLHTYNSIQNQTQGNVPSWSVWPEKKRQTPIRVFKNIILPLWNVSRWQMESEIFHLQLWSDTSRCFTLLWQEEMRATRPLFPVLRRLIF